MLLERTLARRVPVEERRWATRGWARLDESGLLFVGLLLGLVFLLHWGYKRASPTAASPQFRSGPWSSTGTSTSGTEIETFGVRGTSGDYAFGAAVLWTPFFLACHAWLGFLNLLGGHFPTDGFAR